MPKRGRDRRTDQDPGPGANPNDGMNAGDEDYDWIRYLGDGRSSSSKPEAPAPNLPRRDRQSTGLRPGGSRTSGGGPGNAGAPGSAGGTFGGVGAGSSRGTGSFSRRADPPTTAMTGGTSRQGSFNDSVSRPGGGFPADSAFPPSTARRETTRVTDQPGRPKIDFEDYAAPLYPDQGSAESARLARDKRFLDSDVYARPLYPAQDTGPGTAIRDRRPTRPNRTGAPGRAPAPDWPDDPGDPAGPSRTAEPEWAAQAPAPAKPDRGAALDRRNRGTALGRHGRNAAPERSRPGRASGLDRASGPDRATGASGTVNAYPKAWPYNVDGPEDAEPADDRPDGPSRAPVRDSQAAAPVRTRGTGTLAPDEEVGAETAGPDIRRPDKAKRSAGAGGKQRGRQKAGRQRSGQGSPERRPGRIKASVSAAERTELSPRSSPGTETTAGSKADTSAGRARPGTRSRRKATRLFRRLPRKLRITAIVAAVLLVAAAVGYLILPPQRHVISVPDRLGGFVKQPTLAKTTAQDLKQKIIAGASGEVKNVVAAVYEKTAGAGTTTGPQVVVFIGGNLTGGMSASSLISAYKAELHGSFTTSAGHLGGLAACAPGSHGGPAECAWADGDTFGVIVSASLSATALANEMRSMRPLVEKVVR